MFLFPCLFWPGLALTGGSRRLAQLNKTFQKKILEASEILVINLINQLQDVTHHGYNQAKKCLAMVYQEVVARVTTISLSRDQLKHACRISN